MFSKNDILNKRIPRMFFIFLLSISLLSACAQNTGGTETADPTGDAAIEAAAGSENTVSVEFDDDDEDAVWDNAAASDILLSGSEISFDGTGATVDGSSIRITSAGTYVVSGTLSDGQIIVDTEDTETVRLVLNGAAITCPSSAPIYVMSAEKTVLILADGTENAVTDGSSYQIEDTESDEPDAAVFSKDDLTITGNGSLTVSANYKDAIVSKDKLKITGGTITINSVDDGIRGKDFVAVKNAAITITADGDGIKSTNDTDADKGFIYIESGKIEISAGADAIQAETCILIEDGDITLQSGGGSANSVNANTQQGMRGGFDRFGGTETAVADTDEGNSAKGLKAGADITIKDGSISVDSADDSIHSNGSITISGGSISLQSGDDGVHADSSLAVGGGEITISKSYEGLESAIITISDGEIHVTASDDGINVAGGSDSSSMGGRPGQNSFDSSGDYYLNINGGYIVIDASGDGLDSNGSIVMDGGVVLVSGPTNSGNGALDYNGSFNINGGFLVAAGSSGMAEAPGASSTQRSVSLTFDSVLEAGTMVCIQNEDGEEILTFVPEKEYQNVVFSSPDLEIGSTYRIYYGGSSTGSDEDGLYSGGAYTSGTEYTSFTVSETVTTAGAAGASQFGGGPGGGRPSGGGGKP